MSAPRSRFVTVLAWMFIAGGALSLVWGAFSMLVWAMVAVSIGAAGGDPGELLAQAGLAPLPTELAAVFDHATAWQVFTLAMSAVVLVLGIGLLRRRPWGRVGSIVFLWLTVVLNLGGAVLTWWVWRAMTAWLATMPDVQDLMQAMWVPTAIAMGVIVVMFIGVNVWLTQRLGAPDIRAEFD